MPNQTQIDAYIVRQEKLLDLVDSYVAQDFIPPTVLRVLLIVSRDNLDLLRAE